MSQRSPRVALGPDHRPVGRDPGLHSLLAAYQASVVRLRALDAVTTELVRLRCARQHDCRICQALRLADSATAGATDEVASQIDHYEDSDLSDRHKVALRIVDAFIWQPSGITPELAQSAHEHFTDDELAEVLLDITKWSTQKIHVALGTDGADRLPTNDSGVAYFSFGDDGAVARITDAVDTSLRPTTRHAEEHDRGST
ncbi:MAG: carboxymuconolactone decarboxylase family protein [Candidatus Nanopelagicales bacterium]